MSEGSGRAGRGKKAWLLSVCAPWEFRVFWATAQEQTGEGMGEGSKEHKVLWKQARTRSLRLCVCVSGPAGDQPVIQRPQIQYQLPL